mmetsp:Transcript_50941/g.111067  ORF Transcript_50941/g.111067 Transcript_50941/m.111067 type:complete len:212 (-) Transcript_50941:614-1249(-)
MFSSTAATMEQTSATFASVDAPLKLRIPAKPSLKTMVIRVMTKDHKPFQKTKCNGFGLTDTNSCCHTPRADRSIALTAARRKAAREACGSPRTQQTLPAQTNETAKTEMNVKLRLPLIVSKQKVTNGTFAATMETKATPPKRNALLLVRTETPFKAAMGRTGKASAMRGRSKHRTTRATLIMCREVMVSEYSKPSLIVSLTKTLTKVTLAR